MPKGLGHPKIKISLKGNYYAFSLLVSLGIKKIYEVTHLKVLSTPKGDISLKKIPFQELQWTTALFSVFCDISGPLKYVRDNQRLETTLRERAFKILECTASR